MGQNPQPSSAGRVARLRRRMRDRGLKRVEVYVPEPYAEDLRAYAAELQKRADDPALMALDGLVKQAFGRYARYLESIDVNPARASRGEARAVADALIKRGDKGAFQLGRSIHKMAAG
ncbi:MAG: hypothetical protein OEM59_09435 [Rhodospirillales bacterium]|nr:hypothetical protein [Rhodospirillales bacterium]